MLVLPYGGTSICPRIIRNHFMDHEEIQSEHSNEASQHHQEVTSKTKRYRLADPTPEATEKHRTKICINQRSQIT